MAYRLSIALLILIPLNFFAVVVYLQEPTNEQIGAALAGQYPFWSVAGLVAMVWAWWQHKRP